MSLVPEKIEVLSIVQPPADPAVLSWLFESVEAVARTVASEVLSTLPSPTLLFVVF